MRGAVAALAICCMTGVPSVAPGGDAAIPSFDDVDKALKAHTPPPPPPSKTQDPPDPGPAVTPKPPDPKPPDPTKKPDPPGCAYSAAEIAAALAKFRDVGIRLQSAANAAVEKRRKEANNYEKALMQYACQRYNEAYGFLQDRVKRDNSTSNKANNDNGYTDVWLAKTAALIHSKDPDLFLRWLAQAKNARQDQAEQDFYAKAWQPQWAHVIENYPGMLENAKKGPDELWKLIEELCRIPERGFPQQYCPRPYALFRLQHLAEMYYMYPKHPRVADGTCGDRFMETLTEFYLDEDAAKIAREFYQDKPETGLVKSGEISWRLASYVHWSGKFDEAALLYEQFRKAYPNHAHLKPRMQHGAPIPPLCTERLDQCSKHQGKR